MRGIAASQSGITNAGGGALAAAFRTRAFNVEADVCLASPGVVMAGGTTALARPFCPANDAVKGLVAKVATTVTTVLVRTDALRVARSSMVLRVRLEALGREAEDVIGTKAVGVGAMGVSTLRAKVLLVSATTSRSADEVPASGTRPRRVVQARRGRPSRVRVGYGHSSSASSAASLYEAVTSALDTRRVTRRIRRTGMPWVLAIRRLGPRTSTPGPS